VVASSIGSEQARIGSSQRKRPLMIDFRQGDTVMRTMMVAALSIVTLAGCQSREMPMDTAQLREFATNYTAAWCSQNPANVAAHFAEGGSLKINDGTPSVGRTEITAAAQSFMTALPDMVVTMDGISLDGDHGVYRWTLTGTNTGPGGTGNAVRISGYEEWTIGADGLIAESKGNFDETDYERQLNAGTEES